MLGMYIYDTIIQAVSNNAGGLYFLDAPGGTGKTFVISLILATIRSEEKIALALASSGIAATLLEGGRTAHSALKLPLNVQPLKIESIDIDSNKGLEVSTWRSRSRSTKRAATWRQNRNRLQPPKMNLRGFITRKEVKGGRIEVPSNPPEVTYQRWQPITVVINHSGGELKCTTQDVVASLSHQIDPVKHGLLDVKGQADKRLVMNIRYRSIRAWNITGRMIALSVNDISSTDSKVADVDTLCGLVDTGSAQHTPAVGYKLPASLEAIVIRNDDSNGNATVFHVITPPNDNSIIYVNIFWKFDGPSKVSIFSDQMLQIVRQIKANTLALSRDSHEAKVKIRNINENVGKIAEQTSPSILKTVIKGVELAGEVVVASAADEDRRLMQDLIDSIRTLPLESRSDISIVDVQPEKK